MVVQHNLTAINSNRMLGINVKNLASATEKLSSGYRINRSADDAAGLSISEKMRKQIRGLTQASSNSEDGISMVQTAEGALTEVHDMLQRMNELAVKAATGTTAPVDRQYIQDEIDQLISEIDRVAETTKFNEIYLLKGDRANGYKNIYTFEYSDDVDGRLFNADGKEVTEVELQNYFDERGTYTGGLYTNIQARPTDLIFSTTTADHFIQGTSTTIGKYISRTVQKLSENMNVDIQAGADSDRTNKITIDINALTSVGLGVDILSSSKIGIVDEDGGNSTSAITVIAEAIQRVSTVRSRLGAVQNRLEHTIKNLDNVVENTTASESQIRDTDMAKQMVEYSNLSILTQAAQSMLAQNNQANQGVLSILQ